MGREISSHPLLAGFDVGLTPADQIAYRASRDNDLSYTSQGALAVRRMLVAIPNLDEQLVFIVKVNGVIFSELLTHFCVNLVHSKLRSVTLSLGQ